MTSFEENYITFSFTDIFDTLSIYPNDYYDLHDEFELKLKKDFCKIKLALICLVLLLTFVSFLYILKNYKLIVQDFQNRKILYMPKNTLFFSQICLTSFYFYKKIMKITDNMLEYILENNKNRKQIINPENNNLNNVWQDISDRCLSNFDKVFKDIICDFENDEIINSYNSFINKKIDIKDENLKNTVSKLNEKYKLDIIEWEKTNTLITSIFSEKYKEFKTIELKLLEIKSKMLDLGEWSKSTESLLKKLEDKDTNIKKIIDNYIKTKLDNLNFYDLISKYQELILELRVIIKFLKKNPDIELLSKCQICLTNLKDSIIVPCGHTACKDCLDYQQKLDKKIICPICRQVGSSIGKIFN